MIEAVGDMWTFGEFGEPDAICITTNGHVTKAGKCVMGRGNAEYARDTFPGIDAQLAEMIGLYGNRAMKLRRTRDNGPWIVAFPVKHHWRERANLQLIQKSTWELSAMADKFEWRQVILPRPGVRNGRRSWDEVRPILEVVLDDRFVVITDTP